MPGRMARIGCTPGARSAATSSRMSVSGPTGIAQAKVSPCTVMLPWSIDVLVARAEDPDAAAHGALALLDGAAQAQRLEVAVFALAECVATDASKSLSSSRSCRPGVDVLGGLEIQRRIDVARPGSAPLLHAGIWRVVATTSTRASRDRGQRRRRPRMRTAHAAKRMHATREFRW